MCCTGSSCSRYSTRTLYTLISNYRVRYSKVGEHTKAISYVGGTVQGGLTKAVIYNQ